MWNIFPLTGNPDEIDSILKAPVGPRPVFVEQNLYLVELP